MLAKLTFTAAPPVATSTATHGRRKSTFWMSAGERQCRRALAVGPRLYFYGLRLLLRYVLPDKGGGRRKKRGRSKEELTYSLADERAGERRRSFICCYNVGRQQRQSLRSIRARSSERRNHDQDEMRKHEDYSSLSNKDYSLVSSSRQLETPTIRCLVRTMLGTWTRNSLTCRKGSRPAFLLHTGTR